MASLEVAVLEQLDAPSVERIEGLVCAFGHAPSVGRAGKSAVSAALVLRARSPARRSPQRPRPGRGSRRPPPPSRRAAHGARRRARRSRPRCARSRSRSRTRETSLRTIASSALALELLAGPLIASAPCSAANPTIVCSSRAPARERGEDVLGRARGRARGRRCPRGGSSRPRPRVGRKSADGGRHQEHVAGVELRPEPRRRARRRSRRRSAARRPARRATTLAATRVTSAPRRAARSARAKPIRPLERLPMKRTESIGSRVPPARDQHSQAVPRPARRRGAAPRPRRAGAQATGSLPTPYSPREASAPSSGSITADAALAQGRQVRLRRRVAVHPVVHRRGDSARRGAGEERGGEHRVGDARRRAWRSCWPRPARPGRRRRWRRPRGGRSGRGRGPRSPGKAPRSGSRSNSSIRTGAPTMPSNEAAPTNRVRGRRHQHAHAVTGARSPAAPAPAPCRRRFRRSRRAGCGPSEPPTRGACSGAVVVLELARPRAPRARS